MSPSLFFPYSLAAIGTVLEMFDLKTSHWCYVAAIIMAIHLNSKL